MIEIGTPVAVAKGGLGRPGKLIAFDFALSQTANVVPSPSPIALLWRTRLVKVRPA
jgi:hypothetical protein